MGTVLNAKQKTTLLLTALLAGCASVPPQSVRIETREVMVPVREPLPAECFEDYKAPALAAGALSFRTFEEWTDGLVDVIQRYRLQHGRCRALNDLPAHP